MSQENSYNPTSSAYKPVYDKLAYFKDNPLVKQFSVKSLNEIYAAEHNYRNKLKTLDVKNPKDAEKYVMYESVLETLDMMSIQCINLSADLLFEETTTQTIETSDAVVIEENKEQTTTKEVKPTLDVVKSPKTEKSEEKNTPVVDAETDLSEEKSNQPIISLPKEPIDDKAVRSTMHDAVAKKESKENLIAWLKQMKEKELFMDGSRILGSLERGEGDERYIKYVEQFIKNPATGPREEAKTKSEVTEIALPEEPISFNKMKEEVKKAYKNDVSDEVVDKYVLGMINAKLIKHGHEKVKTKKERLGWELNVKKGVENARKKQAQSQKAAAKLEKEDTSIETILPEVTKDEGAPTELLLACQNAENELKAGNRDKAVGIIKHYLGEYGGEATKTFSDIDIQALLNWIDEDIFHHRNPMDILHKIPLSLTDVIKEVEKQTKIEGKSRKDIQDLIFSKVEGVKMREMESVDDIIRDKEEFVVWFESNCGFVFQGDQLSKSHEAQKAFEQTFEDKIRKAEPEKTEVLRLLKEYREGLKEFGTKLGLDNALKIVVSKLEALNPELKKAYDKPSKKKSKKSAEDKAAKPIAIPETSQSVDDTKDTKTEKDGSSKEDDPGKGSVGPVQIDPKLMGQTKKVKTLEGLTNFILKHSEVDVVALFGLSKNLIAAGQITDAVTEFETDKPTPWDQQQVSNWFRMGPEKLLSSIDIVSAKNSTELKNGIKNFVKRNPSFEQEEVLTKVSELMEMPSAIQSKHVRKQIKHKNFKINLQKLYEQVLEENHVHTT